MQNNRAAQEMLYKLFYADMYRLCQRYISDAQDTLSVVNDGFLKVFRNIAQYKPELGHFKSWLKTIMINTSIDHIRSNKKDMRLIYIDQLQEKGDEDFLTQYRWKHEELMLHLNNLPAVTRTVVNLFAFDGYTHKEIAEHLEISETTSRWHLAEARKRLRQSLQLSNPKMAKHE